MAADDLAQARLHFLLDYDPVTGALNWKNPTSERVAEGRCAGVLAGNGRRYVDLDNKRYLAHRVIWFYVHGKWPSANLAALNGNYDDLSLANYEERTARETARGGGARTTNTSGIRGVSWDKTKGKWLAYITHNYKSQYIGRFDTKEEAGAAREAFERNLGRVPQLDPQAQIAKAARVAKNARLHVLWRKTLKQTNSVTGWASFEQFAQDVGSAPDTRMILVPIDAEKTLGPGNFTWKPAAKWDYSTSEGRHEYMLAHRADNRNSYRDKALRRNFGITIDDYNRMLAEQGGVCACCGEPETASRDGKPIYLSVDHCHDTSIICGLLCIKCNRGLGYFREDTAYLHKAVQYLQRCEEKIAAAQSTTVPASNVIPLKTKER